MDAPDELGFTTIRTSYDVVAAEYDARFSLELTAKVFDRALLTALLELAGPGVVADVGCGSGQITRFLTGLHSPVVGIDLSPAMVDRARVNAPDARFEVASMTDLPVEDGAWAGVVAMYSVVNLTTEQRAAAYRELARVLHAGGWLLLSFHIESTDGTGGPMGGQLHLSQWFEHDVDLTFYYLDPAQESAALEAAGFVVTTTTVRRPLQEVEAQTRRCYLLAQRP